MPQKNLALTQDRQIDAWDDAVEAVEQEFDVDDPVVGDVVQVLAESFTGTWAEHPGEALREVEADRE